MEARSRELMKKALKNLTPPLEMSVSEWADEYRMLSPEASAVPGKWYTDTVPFARRVMDCISSEEISEITCMFAVQIAKTEIILNSIGRYMHLDPCPIMVVLPDYKLVEAFSKDRLTPMIRDTEVLNGLVKNSRERDSGNTVSHKKFPGGQITIVGAHSPSGLASRPIRIVCADEVDRYPATAGKEGDPLDLVEKRTTTFWNRKHIRVSSPTIKGISRIYKLYKTSSQEEWCLPCPSCGELQPLDWDKVKYGDDIDGVVMECTTCGALHSEKEWKSVGQINGDWIAKHPERLHKGFHANQLASHSKSWEEIVGEYLNVKDDPERFQTWVNTVLGLPWEEEVGDKIDYQTLYDKRIPYPADLPNEVLILTAGVDVQDDRLEIEVVGWGLGERSYGIEYKKFYGNPAKDEVWEKLDGYLQKDFYYADGSHLNITNTCVDTGGHHTKKTYDFIAPRESKRVFGIKGRGGDGVPIINKPKKDKTNKIHLIPIGVNALKDLLFSRLKIESGPGACYFPTNPDKNYDIKYFRSLTAEVKTFENGKIVWKQIRDRNEGIDLRDYATAAFTLLRVNLEKLAELRAKNDAGKIGRL